MPRTLLAFLVGSLALVGMPPFAGFFSKDSILAAALDAGGYGCVLSFVGLVGAFLTGLYTFRLLLRRLQRRAERVRREHPPAQHAKAPASRWLDRRRAGGALRDRRLAPVRGVWKPIDDWLEPVAAPLVDAHATGRSSDDRHARRRFGLGGIGVAWLDLRREARAGRAASCALLEHKFYFDELYDALFYRPAVCSLGLPRSSRGR